jgi:hypothetical protein
MKLLLLMLASTMMYQSGQPSMLLHPHICLPGLRSGKPAIATNIVALHVFRDWSYREAFHRQPSLQRRR